MIELQKCKYFNNHQTACSLMIDDLVPVAVTPDGIAKASNDWGYLANKPNSLYRYFEKQLLNQYPEIKGTLFVPIKSHLYIDDNSDYKVLKREFDTEYKTFINEFCNHFDLAFHGIKHTYFEHVGNTKEIRFEFNQLTMDEIPSIQKEIKKFEDFFEIKFTGGKYPGYLKNEFGEQIISELGYQWWCDNAIMINKKHFLNQHTYDNSGKILLLPSNITGDIFFINKKRKKVFSRLKQYLKSTFYSNLFVFPENYLSYLIRHRLPITIQEHFQNQRTDGKRQTPNIYDDVNSINRIYDILRGADIWHVTCSDLAHYLESYDNTEIKVLEESQVEIKYIGNWPRMFLSFTSTHREIKNMETGKVTYGVYKNSKWIYNNLLIGRYKMV